MFLAGARASVGAAPLGAHPARAARLQYPEIAQLLQLPEGTVKSALNRGRARLIELMARRATEAGGLKT